MLLTCSRYEPLVVHLVTNTLQHNSRFWMVKREEAVLSHGAASGLFAQEYLKLYCLSGLLQP